jgi:hypothetical protein
MTMTETVLKGYLIIVVLGGMYGIVAGLIVAFKEAPNAGRQVQSHHVGGQRWKMFLRGFSTLAIGLCFWFFFFKETLGSWTIVLSVALLLITQEYALNAICRSKTK